MENLDELAERLTAVEQRLAALEAGAPAAAEPSMLSEEVFWVVDGIRRRVAEEGGAVIFAGSVQVAEGPVEWQYGRTADDLLAADWSPSAKDLAALGHPVRLALLQAVLSGTRTVGDLAERLEMGSTGQLYHHLNQLSARGWLVSGGRGSYSVPAERVVPLLVLITATRSSS